MQNVHTLLYAVLLTYIPLHSWFIQLLDDDVVSLISLTLIVNPRCRYDAHLSSISQLTLLLYLMSQCQLKLSQPVTSLAQTLSYIKFARIKFGRYLVDQLTLKLSERKMVQYLEFLLRCSCLMFLVLFQCLGFEL